MSPRPLPFATTIEVRDTCLCLHVQRAARLLARHFDDALRPFGLTQGQFSLLMSLNRPAPPPLGPVAELLSMDRTTLTAALKVLERRGLARSGPDPKDRRSRLLHLTLEGQSLLASALPAWRAAHAAVDAVVGQDVQPLRSGLNALSALQRGLSSEERGRDGAGREST